LSSALKEAERLDMIPRNPLDKLRGALPLGPAPEAQPADKATIDREIAALPVGDQRRMALYLALALGLRRGEICGLRWRDIGDSKITVREQIVPVGKGHVTKAPKYDSGREIAIGPRVAEALQQHRRALAERLLACGIRLTTDDPVCAGDDGRSLRPGSLTGWCTRRGLRLHGVRHLNASTLIMTQPIPIVTQRLGHSRPDVTLRTYSHVLPGQDDAAAEAIDAVIGV
jgi:integrase